MPHHEKFNACIDDVVKLSGPPDEIFCFFLHINVSDARDFGNYSLNLSHHIRGFKLFSFELKQYSSSPNNIHFIIDILKISPLTSIIIGGLLGVFMILITIVLITILKLRKKSLTSSNSYEYVFNLV